MDCRVQAPVSSTLSRSLLKFMSIESVMPSNHLIFCSYLLLPSISPSIRVFSNESALHIRWPKYWSFRTSLSNDYAGLISFRIDWFDLLAVQRILKSLLKHHNSKASVLQCSPFFMAQLSHLCIAAGKTIALTIQTFVNKGLSCQGYDFSSSHVWMWELDHNESWAKELMLLNRGVGEDSWESLGLQGDPTSPS